VLRRAAGAVSLAAMVTYTGIAPAVADDSVTAPHDCGLSICLGADYVKKARRAQPQHPSKGLAGAAKAKKPVCTARGHGDNGDLHAGVPGENPAEVEVPCYDADLGSFSSGCYFKPASPPPPADNPVWKGHKPGDGAIYLRTCPIGDNRDMLNLKSQGMVWMAKPPAASAVDPVRLAEQAVDKMALEGPEIVSPRNGASLTVGVPVWMHVEQSPTTFGPTRASASAGDITVAAEAKVSAIRWSMGDGSTVTCHGPGSSYRASAGLAKSPDCGHLYERTSRSGENDRFPVRATATWQITWTGGGQNGELTRTRESQVSVRVGEIQAVGR
jgi:hypothetical protein